MFYLYRIMFGLERLHCSLLYVFVLQFFFFYFSELLDDLNLACRKFQQDEDLKILQQIIRKSYEALSDDPRQLASQLLNRLDDKVN